MRVDLMQWALIGGGAALAALILIAVVWCAPSHTQILIDTPGSTARADMRLLWGIGPAWSLRALPKEIAGNPLPSFYDPARVGAALMTPGIADVTYAALQRLFALKPRSGRFELGVNLPDSAQARVVNTAIQAVLAAAPASLRESIVISQCEAQGAELIVRFDVSVSPMQLNGIFKRFKTSRAVREFKRRLKRKPKASKRAPREVRAS
jgi:hypothetical protein